MARGTVVIDENVSGLSSYLQSKNIRVVQPPSGMDDDQIKQFILPNRIIITNNSADFVEDASSGDYGIIALEGVMPMDMESLSKIISKVMTKFSLWSKRHGFILRLKKDGKHEYEELTE